MPEGAISQDLENIPRFRKYAAANVHRWYKFINGARGREAENGEVRLVVGCDKATSWGSAALSNANQHCQLKFKPLDGQTSDKPSHYTWEHSGMAEVRVGPDQEENDELRREDPDDSTVHDNYLNQCLFVRTLNVTLNDDDWENLNHEAAVGCPLDSNAGPGTGTAFPSPSSCNQDSLSDGPPSTASTSGSFGIQRTPSDCSILEFTSLDASANRLTFSLPPTATVSSAFERRAICFNTLFSSHVIPPVSSMKLF